MVGKIFATSFPKLEQTCLTNGARYCLKSKAIKIQAKLKGLSTIWPSTSFTAEEEQTLKRRQRQFFRPPLTWQKLSSLSLTLPAALINSRRTPMNHCYSTTSSFQNQDFKKPLITFFTKDGCTLCDVAMETLNKYRDRFEIEIIDIDDDSNMEWFKRYQYDIPVIHLNGKFLMKHKVFVGAFEDALKNAEMRSAKPSATSHSPNTEFQQSKNYGDKTQYSSEVLNFYSGHYINRCAEIRKNSELLEEKLKEDTSKLVVFKSLQPLLQRCKERRGHMLRTLSHEEYVKTIRSSEKLRDIVFLGTELNNGSNWFAVNLTEDSEAAAVLNFVKEEDSEFRNAFLGMMKLNEMQSSIAAQARGILAWHGSHQFCPECGTKSDMAEGGYRRRCRNENCNTRKVESHHACYPRVDPVTMVLVVSPDEKSILLGRKAVFPPRFFTCLAGFMEPGESFETTVRREIYEESGLKVGNIRYQLSQCWPFPSSVMFGCSATAEDTNLKVDQEELEEVCWFTKEEAAQLISKETYKEFMAGKKVRIAPGKHALAHHLVKRWVDGKC